MPDTDANASAISCPSCDSRMKLTATERHRPGFDRRTFHCGPCDKSLFFVVPFKSDH